MVTQCGKLQKGQGLEFVNDVKQFIYSAFNSEFKKILSYNKNGDLIKEELVWTDKPELRTISLFGGPFQLIRKWYTFKSKNSELRVSEVNYSKFI